MFLGMEISVALPWFIIAQVLGLITIFFDFWSYQIKDQRKYLLVFSIGSLFWMLMFIAVGAQVPIILAAAFSVLRGMVFWWIFAKDTKKRRVGGRVFLYVALAIGLGGAIIGVINATPETRWLQIVMLVTALLFVVGQYLPSKHYVRAFAMLYAIAVLLLNTPLDTFNPMGILIEVAKIVSIVVFYVLLVRKGYLVKKLKEIKQIIADEVAKITADSKANEVATIMPQAKLERIVAKMIRYELAAIDYQALTNFDGIENETRAVLEDIQTVADVKNILATAIQIKAEKMERLPKGASIEKPN
ncbi:MAG: YgjV family protein [Firmicutes bacterium]|nr:YgjV family protein [Bacillota bacterium]